MTGARRDATAASVASQDQRLGGRSAGPPARASTLRMSSTPEHGCSQVGRKRRSAPASQTSQPPSAWPLISEPDADSRHRRYGGPTQKLSVTTNFPAYWSCTDTGLPETLIKSQDACLTHGVLQMPTSGSPTVQRRRLAAELRRLRVDAQRTAEDVGKILGWSKAKVSRYELAQSGLKPTDVARLLDVYGVQDRRRAQLLALAEEATLKGWWEAYSDVLTEAHMAFIGLEAEATAILEWHINVIPGLLQTEQYAREIISGYNRVATISPRTIERRLETRLLRQQLLARDEPLEYVALLDESVLTRQRGDRSVMRSQLQRLADAAELPSVTVRILPLHRSHGLAVDSFAILKFSQAHETTLRNVVSIEHLSGSELYVEGDTDTNTFELAFKHLENESLSPADSRELVLTTCRQVWSAP